MQHLQQLKPLLHVLRDVEFRPLAHGTRGALPAVAMKNTTLALFAALIFFGWTALAGGVLAVLAGDPVASSRKHDHVVPQHGVELPAAPLLSDAPCPLDAEPGDASGPGSA